MKIKLIKVIAGPIGVFQPNSVVDFDQEFAEALIEAHAAEDYVEPEAAPEEKKKKEGKNK